MAVAEQQANVVRRRARTGNDLVSLCGPVLELVLKLQAGLIAPSNDLQPMFDRLLGEMEQRAATLRYNPEQVQNAKFALVAFTDETVLTRDFPLREQWEKQPLQLKHFGEHLAGVKYFERLEKMMANAEAEADVIEVYYVCMLLGYKGKYKVYLEDQLKGVIAGVADALRKVGRLHEGELSPHWKVMDQPTPPKDPGVPLWLKIGSGVVVLLVILIFIALNFLLRSDINTAKEQLLR
ncbi:MAG: type IVB secretion system protein IcmH/DotU [Pyrinomonadaceae bacterium]